jgi:hypothetical protein
MKKTAMMKSGVYFLRSRLAGLTKIGHSSDYRSRIDSHKTSSPDPHLSAFVIPHKAPQKLEAFLHKKYMDCRSHGEWFNLSEVQIEGIREHYADKLVELQVWARPPRCKMVMPDEVLGPVDLNAKAKWAMRRELALVHWRHSVGKALKGSRDMRTICSPPKEERKVLEDWINHYNYGQIPKYTRMAMEWMAECQGLSFSQAMEKMPAELNGPGDDTALIPLGGFVTPEDLWQFDLWDDYLQAFDEEQPVKDPVEEKLKGIQESFRRFPKVLASPLDGFPNE